MSAKNNNKDFLDKIFDVFEPYQKLGVRFLAVTICFIIFFIVGLLISPQIIQMAMDLLPFEIELLQISPAEILFNYLKIALCFSLIFTFPIFIYQFGKLKAEKLTFDFKMNLLIAAFAYITIVFVCIFTVYKFILPFIIFFLYGLNFNISTITASVSSMVSTLLTTILFSIMVAVLPFVKIVIQKLFFFNYATLVQLKKPILLYAGIVSALLVLPFEILIVGLIFLLFLLWYKIVVILSKKRD